MLLTPVNSLSLVSTILGINTKLWISLRIFEKLEKNGLNAILRGPGGNWFMKKTWRQKSRVSRLTRSTVLYKADMWSTVYLFETLCTQPFRNLSLLAYWNSDNNDSSLTLWSVSLEIQIFLISCEKLLLRNFNAFQKTFSSQNLQKWLIVKADVDYFS